MIDQIICLQLTETIYLNNNQISSIMNRESFSFDNCVSKIVDLYLTRSNNTHLVLHQLDSYNRFIKEYLPFLIKQHNPYCLYYNYQHIAL